MGSSPNIGASNTLNLSGSTGLWQGRLGSMEMQIFGDCSSLGLGLRQCVLCQCRSRVLRFVLNICIFHAFFTRCWQVSNAGSSEREERGLVRGRDVRLVEGRTGKVCRRDRTLKTLGCWTRWDIRQLGYALSSSLLLHRASWYRWWSWSRHFGQRKTAVG